MSSRESSPLGPLIVGVVPEQPPEIIAQAALLAEQLGRTIVFVYVEPHSQSSDWNLTLRMTDVPIPPLDISEDMSARATHIFAAIGSFMSGNATRWMLRVVGGEPWVAMVNIAVEKQGSMFVIGTRAPKFTSYFSEFLNGSMSMRLSTQQHLPVLLVPAENTKNDARPCVTS